jgi:hypothetical protein
MNGTDTQRKRAIASGNAKTRLVREHYEEYSKYYKEECARLGLNTALNKRERIERARKMLEQMEAQYLARKGKK